MHLQPEYLREYLAAVNKVLRNPEQPDLLTDFLHPLKLYLTKRTRTISFALARYCGAKSQTALTAEWLYQASQLNYDKSALLEENTLYFNDKYASQLKAYPNLRQFLYADITSRFVPLQLKHLRETTRDLVHRELQKTPSVAACFSTQFLALPVTTKFRLQEAFYTRAISPDLFASQIRYGEGFFLVVLPCLVGLGQTNELASNTRQGLEEVLYGISTLYELNTHFATQHYYYLSKLPTSALTGWYVSSPEYRREKVRQDWNTQKYVEQLRARYRLTTLNLIRTLEIDGSAKLLLKDLVGWANSG